MDLTPEVEELLEQILDLSVPPLVFTTSSFYDRYGEAFNRYQFRLDQINNLASDALKLSSNHLAKG
jgi:hypothetical protein